MSLDVTQTGQWEVHQVAAATQTLECVPSHYVTPNANHQVMPVAGSLWGKVGFTPTLAPVAGFDTYDVGGMIEKLNHATLFGTAGDVMAEGRAFGTEGSPLSLKLYCVKRNDLGGFASGSVHGLATMIEGLVQVQQIVAPTDGLAMASLMAHAMQDSDGNDPVGFTTNNAKPATTASDQAYCCGPLYIATNEIAMARGFTYTPGFGLEKKRTAGNSYPKIGFITRSPAGGPQFTIDMETPINLLDFGIQDVHTATVAATLYLQKMQTYGVRVAKASAVHVKCEITKAMVTTGGRLGGALDSAMTDQLVLTVLDDSMTWTTDVAITVPT